MIWTFLIEIGAHGSDCYPPLGFDIPLAQQEQTAHLTYSIPDGEK